MAELKSELVEAEKNDEEQTASQAEKNDEVAAAQAELEQTVEAYKAARDALFKIAESLKNTTYKALKEAAPDEWAALEAAWSALQSAIEDALNEKVPVAWIDVGSDVLEKFAPLEYEAFCVMLDWSPVGGLDWSPVTVKLLASEIAAAAYVESLIAAARFKQVTPVEWAAYEAAYATLKEKAPAECTAYEAALARKAAWNASRSVASHASSVRRSHDALLDAEWHAKWAEQLAHVADTEYEVDEDVAICTAVAALAALLQAFVSASKADKECAPDPYKAARRASVAVHKAFLNTVKGKGESYFELRQLKNEADKDRQERKDSS